MQNWIRPSTPSSINYKTSSLEKGLIKILNLVYIKKCSSSRAKVYIIALFNGQITHKDIYRDNFYEIGPDIDTLD